MLLRGASLARFAPLVVKLRLRPPLVLNGTLAAELLEGSVHRAVDACTLILLSVCGAPVFPARALAHDASKRAHVRLPPRSCARALGLVCSRAEEGGFGLLPIEGGRGVQLLQATLFLVLQLYALELWV